MSFCTKCHESKPLADFYARPRSKKGHYSECKICTLAMCRRWQKANPDKVKKFSDDYRARHPDKMRENNRKAREAADPKKLKATMRMWQINNAGKCAAWASKRKAIKLQATLSPDPRIDAIYEIAAWLRLLGDDVHVDHIAPLQPSDPNAPVGLHVYANLQILSAQDNRSKGNR